METADMKRFAMIMCYLNLNFPEREVKKELVDSYFRDLSDFSIDAIEPVILPNGTFIPLLQNTLLP